MSLPILIAMAGGILEVFNVGNVDLITYMMYIVGMAETIVCVLLMRHTTKRGAVAPFIMELPEYHLPQFKSVMIHLQSKTLRQESIHHHLSFHHRHLVLI